MARQRLLPLDPKAENLPFIRTWERWITPVFKGIMLGFQPLSCSGLENFPQEGPVLVVANHVTFLDPINVILMARRPVHWLAADTLFRRPGLGHIVRWSGGVPKKKFVNDLKAVRNLKKWRDLGGAVGLFPEGETTWDGRLAPFVEGIEKLVQLMDAPVLPVRIHNAHRQWPRWGRVTRHSAVHIEFGVPRKFERRAPADEILGWMRKELDVDQFATKDWRIFGRRLAEGVTNVLFACPACHAPGALVEARSTVRCGRCEKAWELDYDHQLLPRDGGAPLRLMDAIDAVRARWAERWTDDPGRLERDGIVLQSGPYELIDADDDDLPVAARGDLRLTRDAVQIVADGALRFAVPLSELIAVNLDLRDVLVLRTEARSWEITIRPDSAWKWMATIRHWQQVARAA